MAMTVMNSAGEIEQAITGKAPERPEVDYVRNEKGQFVSPDAPAEVKAEEKPANGSAKEDADDAPEWVKRLGITKDQHDGVSKVIDKAVARYVGKQKGAEEYAQAQYNERKLAEGRAEAAERELARLKAEAEAAKPVVENKQPTRDQFESDEAYANALIDWRVDQKFKAREVEAAKKAEEARKAEIVKAAEGRIAKAREIVPDFQEVVAAADFVVPPHIAEYMQESELFAEFGYHFAKHPEDLQRLSTMPVRTYGDVQRLGVAISKIEGKLKPFASESRSESQAEVDSGDEPSDSSSGVEPSDDQAGQAPSHQPRVAAPVIQPLNVGSASQVEKPANKRTYEEDRAAYEKRTKRNFSHRARH